MLRMKTATVALAAVAAATVARPARAQDKDIVETAVAAGQFTTLAKALGAAGLVETLKGAGPFTVFAPTDAAFAKLPAGTLEKLLADKAQLTRVLTYHVVPGRLMAADVVRAKSLTTVAGPAAMIRTTNGAMIDKANIVQTDIVTSNGVIHVIDAVILPPPGRGAVRKANAGS